MSGNFIIVISGEEMTYSILVVDKERKIVGIGVASGSIAVGDRVPWIRSGVGVVATQGYTNVSLGRMGLKLLETGIEPQEVLRSLLKMDTGYEYRQLAIMDLYGRKAAFTGKNCPEWKGQYIGEDYVIAGNYLAGSQVIEAAREVMENRELDIPLRLIKALIAGQEAGGDSRGNRSAIIIVENNRSIVIRVDNDPNPTENLLEKYKTKFLKHL